MNNTEFNIRTGWFATLVVVCSFGIYFQATKPLVSPVPIERVAHGKNLKPLMPPQPESLCAKLARCSKLAEAIVYEARGESTKGMAAVAHIILNRKKDPRWPSRVVDVIHQPHQFSYLKDKHKQSKATQEDWNKARKVAYGVLYGHISSPVGDATHYHAKHVRPKWAKKLERVAVIGQHIFYK